MKPLSEITSSVELLQLLRERANGEARKGKVTLAELAARGGFQSRAYVREVFEGERRLTESAIESFSKMLKMTATEKKYLEILVRVEKKLPNAEAQLKKFHSRQRSVLNRKKVKELDASVTPRTFQVYAAVPGAEKGRSCDEIAKACHLSREFCEHELQLMTNRGWIAAVNGLYHAVDGHLVIDELQNSEFLKNWFLEELKTAKSKAEKNFAAQDQLFVTYKFNASAEKLAVLSKSLRSTISAWAEENMDSQGDQVVSLSTAFY